MQLILRDHQTLTTDLLEEIDELCAPDMGDYELKWVNGCDFVVETSKLEELLKSDLFPGYYFQKCEVCLFL